MNTSDPQAGAILGVPPMPPKVAAAIAAVMADMPRLAKSERNSHANYNFAGIDAFLDAVRPACAKAGLIILQDEDSFEVRGDGDKSWLLLRWRFTLAHASGETWGHQPVRTIMVQSKMGSQAFGAAQSYALKQFMRSLFQIATGDDEDADSHQQRPLPSGQGRGQQQRRQPAAEPRRNGAEPVMSAAEIEAFEAEIKRKLADVSDIDGLDALWRSGVSARVAEIGRTDKAAQNRLIAGFSGKKAELQKRAAEAGTKDGLIAVPFVDGKPDWTTWADRFKRAADEAGSIEALDRCLAGHRQTLSNLSYQNKALHSAVLKHVEQRRAALMQAPGVAAA